ncbi:MAG: hypothetical protein QOJ64_3273 [Acidobacteriota bacterium]|jgi:hypothetical protein|nr:hypothetical protein [Acidobacteriota bacterium]
MNELDLMESISLFRAENAVLIWAHKFIHARSDLTDGTTSKCIFNAGDAEGAEEGKKEISTAVSVLSFSSLFCFSLCVLRVLCA